MSAAQPAPAGATLAAGLTAIVSRGDDLTLRQAALLARLVELPGPHGVRDAAAAMEVSKPAITRACDRLLQTGLIHRRGDTTDRRCVILTATPAGEAWVKRARAALTGERAE